MTKLSKKIYTLDNFLGEENITQEVHVVAIKRVIAWQLEQAMQEEQITKKAMAERMSTSRSQLNRLLDPNYTGITLDLLAKAATAVGRELKLDLV